MCSLNDKAVAKPLPQRDRAKQAFLRRESPPVAFTTPEARDGFLIESLRASVVSDLRRLTDLIGREAVGDLLRGEGF